MGLPIGDGFLRTGCALPVWARGPLRVMASQVGFEVPPITDVADVAPLLARVNCGRWIVDCPDCHGAELVWPEQLLMMCAGCWNVAVGHKWRPVAMAVNRAAIEAVLRARPLPFNRNWEPGETTKKLQQENRERGLPIG